MKQIWPFGGVMFGIDVGYLSPVDLVMVVVLVGTLALQFSTACNTV
jgi:hypothetical protein